MTNSVHCTIESEAKMADRKRFANANFIRQIELFSNPVVVLARSKPQLISSDLLSAFPYIRLVKCRSFKSLFPRARRLLRMIGVRQQSVSEFTNPSINDSATPCPSAPQRVRRPRAIVTPCYLSSPAQWRAPLRPC